MQLAVKNATKGYLKVYSVCNDLIFLHRVTVQEFSKELAV
jgi:hypothetical protein